MISTKKIEITLTPKNGGEEKTFESLRKASEYVGVSAIQISRILRGTRKNNTEFFMTSR